MSEVIIPSSPKDRKELNMAIHKIVDSMIRQKAEADFQKEEIKALAEKYALKGKYIKDMAVDYNKHRFDEKVASTEEYAELYEAIMKIGKVSVEEDEDQESEE